YAGLLALGLFATGPPSALAEGPNPAVLQTKDMNPDGFNKPPDFVDETSMPVLGDEAVGGSAATRQAARRSVQVNDPNLDHIQFFPDAVPQPQRPFEFSVQSETSVASFG